MNALYLWKCSEMQFELQTNKLITLLENLAISISQGKKKDKFM